MAELDRRGFNKWLGGVAVGLALDPLALSAQAVAQQAVGNISKAGAGGAAKSAKNKKNEARVIIVGGGAGGASVAHQLKSIAPELKVTLIEPRQTYISCFFSNHYIGGFRSIRSLEHNYDGLAKLGVELVHDYAIAVDPDKKAVALKEGGALIYDKLVLSPGIALNYDIIEGYSEKTAQLMPHAWLAGEQTENLRRRILDMRDGGTVALSVPGNPYRCPSAPYERATLIAHYLKYHKPASKLIILDAKSVFPKMELFEEAWSSEYKGFVEWLPVDKHGGVVKAMANELSLTTRNGDIVKADVVNVIPPQRAGRIAAEAGCVSGDWCPVVPDTFASRLVPDIFVLGDASDARKMPKTAASANSQAHIVANAVAAQLTGKKMFPPRYKETCWSLLGANNAIKTGASYTAGKEAVEMRTAFKSNVKEDKGVRAANYREAQKWYREITDDMFAKG